MVQAAGLEPATHLIDVPVSNRDIETVDRCGGIKGIVRAAGLEPARGEPQQILSLPIISLLRFNLTLHTAFIYAIYQVLLPFLRGAQKTCVSQIHP